MSDHSSVSLRRRRHLPYVVTRVVAAIALVALGTVALAPPSTASEPVKGGQLVFSDVVGLSNFQTSGPSTYTHHNVFQNLFDRLVYRDEASGELVPWLASDWKVSDDGLEYTFTVRDGVTFSDGSKLTAEVVRDNLDLQGRGNPDKKVPPNSAIKNYGSAEVVSDTQVKVTLKEPNYNFLSALSNPYASILGPSTLKLGYEEQTKIENLVGSGAFVFKSQVPEQEIVLVRRDDYAWPPATAHNKGAAYLDRIVFRNVNEVGLRAGAVTSGQVDVQRGIQPTDEQVVTNGGGLIKTTFPKEATSNYIALRPTPANPHLADVRVRQALQVGTNRKDLIESVLTDSYKVSGSIIGRSAEGSVNLDDKLAYDPARANRLLDEAGYAERDSAGYRTKDGKRLTVDLWTDDQSVATRLASEYLQQQWRVDLGVNLVPSIGTNAEFYAALADPAVDGIFSRKVAIYAGGLFGILGPKNTDIHHEDPELVKLLRAQVTSLTKEQSVAALAKVQEYVVEQAYWLPLWDEVQIRAERKNAHAVFDVFDAIEGQESWIEGDK